MNLIDKFYNFERRSDLREFYIGNLWIYPLIKMVIFNALFQKSKSLTYSKKTKLNLAQDLIKDLYWQLIKSKKSKRAKLLFVAGGITRRRSQDREYINIYLSPIIEHLPKDSYNVLEFPINGINHYWPISEKYVMYPDFSHNLLLFKSKFMRSEWLKKDIVNRVNSYFGTSFTSEFLNDRISKFYVFRNYYKNFLKRINPKIIFVVNAYDYKKMAMISAANELKIKTVELQHGIIYESHLAYFYNKLLNRNLLPNFLLTYGDYFSRIIIQKSKAFEPENVKGIGFPYIEKVLQESPCLPEELISLSLKKKIILITSQWVIRDKLIEFTKEVCRLLPEEYFIIYKIHPRERENENNYKKLEQFNNISIIRDKTISSLELMKIAKFHSTVFSTSLFESFKFGLPNVLIGIHGYQKNVENFLKYENVYLAESPKSYIQFLKKIDEKYEEQKEYTLKIADQFFKKNALENFKNFVHSLNIL